MNQLSNIKTLLQQYVQAPKDKQSIFFKTGPGHYAEHDKFLGVTIPNLRKIAKINQTLALEDIKTLIKSAFNEERLLALFILIEQYKKGEQPIKDIIYQFYLNQLKQVNNWNLVDASAHLIIGAHLHQGNKELLLRLAHSEDLWEKRIAIVSTWYFIRHNDLEWTFKIAKQLLHDPHDLIHKAVGWMLREAGKKDQEQLINFLEQHIHEMPRTMLRYSIERFPEQQRKNYLSKPRTATTSKTPKTPRTLGSVDISFPEARRPAACPRDPEILRKTKAYCMDTDRTGSREQTAGRRDLKCQQTLDVIIIGAGISGLTTAKELRQKNYNVLVLEARDRIGGRVWSINPWGPVLDLGASWLHGIENNPISKLIKQASIKTVATSYNSDEFKRKLADMALYDDMGKKIPQTEIDATIPLLLNFEQFIAGLPNNDKTCLNTAFELYTQKEHITGRQLQIFKYQAISSYVYEFADDFNQLSIDVNKPYKNSKVSGNHVIFPEGYIQLADLLAQDIPIKLNQVVTKINYEHPLIEIDTQDQQYYAHTVIITVPVSVLNANKITFHPPLPANKINSFSQIKMGTYNKIFLYFKHLFWDQDKEWIGFIQTSPEQYPVLDIMNYYKFSKQPILLIFNAGKQAEQFEHQSDQQIIESIMQKLRIIYGKNIPEPSSYVITRWHNDPYALGSYSHLAPGVSIDHYKIIGKPVNNRLFFAGEATSLTDPATVHGAYLSGIRAAKEVERVIK